MMILFFRNFFFFIILILILLNCGTNQQDNFKRAETDNSLNKKHFIKLIPLISIDSIQTPEEPNFIFTDFLRDQNGTIYLSDQKNVRIARLNQNGKIINFFLNKGEGPGEFNSYFNFQLTENHLWVIGNRKIAKFKKNGAFIKEYKLKNYYFSVTILNENEFFALHEVYFSGKNMEFKKILGLYDLTTEKLITSYLEELNVGRCFIKRNVALIFDKGILPDIIYAFNPVHKKIYVARNDYYKVQAKALDGSTLYSIFQDYQNMKINDKYKDKIVSSFGNIPQDMKLQIKKKIPKNFCLIKNITSLNSGFLMIFRIIDKGETIIDLYDRQGQFTGTIILPPEVKDKKYKIFDDILSVLEEKEDRNVYREYKIKFPLEAFNKSSI